MHGPWGAPRCSAGRAIDQPTTPSKDRKPPQVTTTITKPLSKYGHGNTQVSSSAPIPKDLPPLLRASAVAVCGKSVGLTLEENSSVIGLDLEIGRNNEEGKVE